MYLILRRPSREPQENALLREVCVETAEYQTADLLPNVSSIPVWQVTCLRITALPPYEIRDVLQESDLWFLHSLPVQTYM